jgi:uncharacterized protein involved in response to NO
MATTSLTAEPDLPTLLRNEPFRIFFPLAFLLGAAGVSHWALFAGGVITQYLGQFHAVSQMQSFLLAFACGFLLTAVPKRTRTGPASWLEIGALGLLVPAVSLLSLFNRLALAEVAYLAAIVLLVQFAVRRFAGRAAGRRPPASFVAVPVGLLAGVGGALLIIAADRGAPSWMHSFGRSLVLEGTFTCLVIGIGAFFLALALRGEAAPDLTAKRGDIARAIAYALAALVAIGGLVLQELGHARMGLSLRALVFTVVFVIAGAHRPPTRPGWNRRLIWLGGWAIPAGLAAAAVFTDHRVAAMHIAYIGGFGLLSLTVAAHVALGHTGFDALQGGRPWPVLVFGLLFLVAAGLRATALLMPQIYFEWLGAAALVWIAGATVWAVFLLPKMWGAKGAVHEAP